MALSRRTPTLLALCLAAALLAPAAAAVALPGGRRLQGLAVSDEAARASKGAAAGASSAALNAKGLSSATSSNAAGVTAAASTDWDFDKNDATGRRLQGLAVSDAAALSSHGAAAGASSAALNAKGLSSATSSNAAGVTAAASTDWDFDKDNTAALAAESAAAPFKTQQRLTAQQRRLGAPAGSSPTDAPTFPDSAYPSGAGGRRLLAPRHGGGAAAAAGYVACA